VPGLLIEKATIERNPSGFIANIITNIITDQKRIGCAGVESCLGNCIKTYQLSLFVVL
jgi:hypothetical protein